MTSSSGRTRSSFTGTMRRTSCKPPTAPHAHKRRKAAQNPGPVLCKGDLRIGVVRGQRPLGAKARGALTACKRQLTLREMPGLGLNLPETAARLE